MKIRFLGLDEVLAIHTDQVERYGGAEGARDLGLLESAVAAPEAMFLFLYVNDLELHCTEDELVELTLGVASSKVTKAEVAVFVAGHVRPVR